METNSSTNSSYSHPRLFKLGDLSREGYNATVVNNICPDSIFTPIFSGIFIFVYLLFVGFGIIGVIWKRNSSYVEARNPLYLILTIIASLFFVMTTCLRYAIGRKLMPCFCIPSLFFVIAPAICLPTVFRCIRIYFMYKLNLEKSKVFDQKANSSTRDKSKKSSKINDPKHKFSSTSTIPTVGSSLSLVDKKAVSFDEKSSGTTDEQNTTAINLELTPPEDSSIIAEIKDMRRDDSEDDPQTWIRLRTISQTQF